MIKRESKIDSLAVQFDDNIQYFSNEKVKDDLLDEFIKYLNELSDDEIDFLYSEHIGEDL